MKNYLFNCVKSKKYILLTGDVLGLAVAVLLSVRICDDTMILSSNDYIFLSAFVIIQLCLFYVYDLYDFNHVDKFLLCVMKCIGSVVGSSFCAVLYVYANRDMNINVYVFVLYSVIVSCFAIAWRYYFSTYITNNGKNTRLAILAHDGVAQTLAHDLRTISGLTLSGHIVIPINGNNNGNLDHQHSMPGRHNGIAGFLKERDFDILAFDSRNGFFNPQDMQEIQRLPSYGKQVHDLPSLYENLTGKVPLMMMDAQRLPGPKGFQGAGGGTYVAIKRLLDIAVSAFLSVFMAPVIVSIAIAVKLGSRGPVFFVQERLGQDCRPFKCYKFRTMIDGAERKSGPVWASQNDPRVTAVGRFLRKSRLDELPQLWNILKGDMTLVGPRPIRESFANELEAHIPFYRLRFCVKPGLTGWAQVNHDYAGSIEGQFEKFQYELFYVKNMSLVLDLLTLFKTLKTVIRQQGT
jgi:exopolysaccharide biosynthesis polyprenyl glycosylphosphotransferase